MKEELEQMKKSRFTEEQIVTILAEADRGEKTIGDICRTQRGLVSDPCLLRVHDVGFSAGNVHARCSSFPSFHIFLGGAPAFFNHSITTTSAW